MAFVGTQVAVGTTATPLVALSANTGSLSNPIPFLIKVPTGATNVYVGGPGVTVGSGYLLTTNIEYSFQVVDEVPYAVAATGQTVYVLQGRF